MYKELTAEWQCGRSYIIGDCRWRVLRWTGDGTEVHVIEEASGRPGKFDWHWVCVCVDRGIVLVD